MSSLTPPAVGFPKPRAYRQTRSFQAQRDPQSDGAAAPRDMMVPEKWGLWLGAALRSESPFSVVPLFPGWEWSKVHCESHPQRQAQAGLWHEIIQGQLGGFSLLYLFSLLPPLIC